MTSALARLEGVISQKITTLKRNLAAENEESISQIANKRFKSGKKPEFKRQGNEEQFDYQTKVKDALQNAFDALVSSKKKLKWPWKKVP